MANSVAKVATAVVIMFSAAPSWGAPPADKGGEATAALSFNRDIRPLLSDSCFACHGPASQEAGVRLDTYEGATDYAVVPGAADDSELIARITSEDPDLRMPPPKANRPPIDAQGVATLRDWINQGAKYERHWAYRPLSQVDPPEVRNESWPRGPIDRFVLRQLEAAGIEPSPPADRETLLRRVYLDLTGLPPTTDEVRAFRLDNRVDAYERVVDRLLASPRHAERMATWWFDLVRFSNTVGYHGDQDQRITPYRDYVLKAFHEGMPFDQFTVEQLAGDLLDKPDLWQRVATGYNRILQTSHEGGIQDGEYRAKMLADRVRNVSEVWLAASIGCAECHDHKFDPYTQRDFYRLGAFFADVDHYGSFVPVAENTSPTVRPPEIYAWTLPVYERIKAIDEQIHELEAKLAEFLPGPEKAAKLRAQLINLRRDRVDAEAGFEPTMVTVATEPREVRVLPRGDWMDTSGEVVAPGAPESLNGPQSSDIQRLDRLDLARWLTDSVANPVTPRVVVNRLWRIAFGAGLTKSLIDMGSQGDPPSHPDLLEWLAADFVASGWSVKHSLREMVLSSTYRQSSDYRQGLADVDPKNRLLARQNRSRLEAEQIRDTALQVGGLLQQQFGGGYLKPYQPDGYYAQLAFPERHYVASAGREQYRRAVYTHWQRQFLHPWLLAFDAPTREECTAQRVVSNTPSAALVLLNDPSFVESARGLATRVLKETPQDATEDDRVRWAWEEATGRPPSADEVKPLVDLLTQHRAYYKADREAAEQLIAIGQPISGLALPADDLAAWTSVSRVLLNLSETITRD